MPTCRSKKKKKKKSGVEAEGSGREYFFEITEMQQPKKSSTIYSTIRFIVVYLMSIKKFLYEISFPPPFLLNKFSNHSSSYTRREFQKV